MSNRDLFTIKSGWYISDWDDFGYNVENNEDCVELLEEYEEHVDKEFLESGDWHLMDVWVEVWAGNLLVTAEKLTGYPECIEFDAIEKDVLAWLLEHADNKFEWFKRWYAENVLEVGDGTDG